MQKMGMSEQSRPEPQPGWRGARRRITRRRVLPGKKRPRTRACAVREEGRARASLRCRDNPHWRSPSKKNRRMLSCRFHPVDIRVGTRAAGRCRASKERFDSMAGKALKNAKNKKKLSPPCSVAASLEKKPSFNDTTLLLQRHHFSPSRHHFSSFMTPLENPAISLAVRAKKPWQNPRNFLLHSSMT